MIKLIPPSQTWALRHSILWPDHPLDYVKLEEDEQGTHFGYWVEGNLVSVISVFINQREAQFRKFATAAEEQGNGYGTLLLQHVLEFAEAKNANRIWCNARKDKASFYEKFGMRICSEDFLKNGIAYVVMEKLLP